MATIPFSFNIRNNSKSRYKKVIGGGGGNKGGQMGMVESD